jgi:hypothetical protein
MDSPDLGQALERGTLKRGNEPPGIARSGEFIDRISLEDLCSMKLVFANR